MRANILLVNSYNLFNMGEVAHLRALRQELPECQFTLASLYSFVDPELCKELRIRIVGDKDTPTRSRASLQSLILIARALLGKARLPLPGLLRAYKESDIVVDLGGDTFSDDPSITYTLAHSISLILALIMGKPYIICSQSVGPFKTRPTRILAKFILSRAVVITARGRVTRDYLIKELGIAESKVREVADLAFLIEPPSWPPHWQNRNSPTIGINPSRTITQWAMPETKVARVKEFLFNSTMSRLVTGLSGDHTVRLIPHVVGPAKGLGSIGNPDDRIAIDKIARGVSPSIILQQLLTHFPNPSNRKTISEAITGCDVFVGCRLHSCIEALTAGIPTVALVYSNKGLDLMGQVNSNLLRVVDVRGKRQYNLETELDIAVWEALGKDRVSSIDSDMRGRAIGSIEAIEETYHKLHREIGKYKSCWVSQAADYGLRERGASSGVVTALLIQALRDKLVERVVVAKCPPLGQPYFKVTDVKEEVREAAGSIYAPPVSLPYFVGSIRSPDGRYGIVGLPCHIRAIRRMIPKDSKLTIGLFCSHAVEIKGVKLLLETMGIDPEKVIELRYRAKRDSETGLLVRTEDREVFIPLSRYWSRFFNFFFIPKGCWACKDLTNEQADISVGDAWRIVPRGNVIVVRTALGRELFEQATASGAIEVGEIKPSDIVKGQRFFLGLKKGKPTLANSTYKVVRQLGSFIADRPMLYPLLRIWLKVAVLERR